MLRSLSSMLLLGVWLLVSCYTATESTPRIKVDKEVAMHVPTAEELVMDSNFVDYGCHKWIEGKVFASIDDRLSPMLRPEGGVARVDSGFMGKDFVYRGFREENTYGNKAVVYLLFECEGSIYSYFTGKSLLEIEQSAYMPLIPSLVDMDDVEMARRLFVGKCLYILSNQWYDANGELMGGRQLVPVTIIDVCPGNRALPLAVVFTDERGVTAHVYMSDESSLHTQMLSFDRLFTYSNPRDAYPTIEDNVWCAITEGRLVRGMTQMECRLSIGFPTEVKKAGTYSGVKEQWLYHTGAYLFFSDGLLEEYRL